MEDHLGAAHRRVDALVGAQVALHHLDLAPERGEVRPAARGEVVEDANLVTALDPAPVGEEFLANPAVRKLTFTGSTEVGKMLAQGAAAQMKRISLELGGHAPFLVFADANPKHAATGASLVKFLNTGQACISPNRIFVHRSILDPFIDELVSRVTRLRGGNGMEDGVGIGPLVDARAVDKVERQVKDAVAKGAALRCGGHRLIDNGLDRGHFYAPTVLSGVDPDALMKAQQKNMDALVAANKAAAAGYQDLFKKQMAIFEETMAEAQKQMKALDATKLDPQQAKAQTPAEAVDYLARALFAGPLTPERHGELVAYLGELPPAAEWADRGAEVTARVAALVVLMVSMPEYQLT